MPRSRDDRYQAYVRMWGPHMGAAEITLVERYYEGGRPYPLIDGELHPMMHTDEIIAPGSHFAPLLLPADFCEPLRDALDEALGRPHDDYRARYEEARDALAVERARVDLLLSTQRSQ